MLILQILKKTWSYALNCMDIHEPVNSAAKILMFLSWIEIELPFSRSSLNDDCLLYIILRWHSWNLFILSLLVRL